MKTKSLVQEPTAPPGGWLSDSELDELLLLCEQDLPCPLSPGRPPVDPQPDPSAADSSTGMMLDMDGLKWGSARVCPSATRPR